MCFRSLEITYNKEDDTYHPYFHLILAVNKSYFTDKDYYLSQENWTRLWKESLQVDYTPVVDVRRVKSKDKNFSKVIAETAKYTVKSEDFLIKEENGKINEPLTDEVVEYSNRYLTQEEETILADYLNTEFEQTDLPDILEGTEIKDKYKEFFCYVQAEKGLL